VNDFYCYSFKSNQITFILKHGSTGIGLKQVTMMGLQLNLEHDKNIY